MSLNGRKESNFIIPFFLNWLVMCQQFQFPQLPQISLLVLMVKFWINIVLLFCHKLCKLYFVLMIGFTEKKVNLLYLSILFFSLFFIYLYNFNFFFFMYSFLEKLNLNEVCEDIFKLSVGEDKSGQCSNTVSIDD